MKILWVPHTSTHIEGWDGSRPYHLFKHLGQSHCLHWVSWKYSQRIKDVWALGRVTTGTESDGTEHSIWLAPNFYRLVTRGYPRPYHVALNQFLFQKALNGIIQDTRPDVLVYSSSHHWTGFPPFPRGCPLLFDYVDSSPEWVEEVYIRNASAVVVVSSALASAGHRRQKPTFVIPNGVELQRYLGTSRRQAKEQLGLSGHTVVSLIGLTCSPRVYFVDAVALLQHEISDLLMLIVGGGSMRQVILQRAKVLGIKNVQAPGSIPNSDIHRYFAATDVGLYPGDDSPYYRQASPLKIAEYSAAGAQVVSSPVDMFRSGWPNVRVAEATAAGFQREILAAAHNPQPPPDLRSYDWRVLAREFEAVLRTIAAENGNVR